MNTEAPQVTSAESQPVTVADTAVGDVGTAQDEEMDIRMLVMKISITEQG